MADRRHDLGTWATAISYNHSLAGVANRWLTQEVVWRDGEMDSAPRASRVAPEVLKAVGLGAMLLFTAAALACSWQGGAGATRPAAWREAAGPPAAALEFGLVFILMLLLSPQSSKPHFCTLVLPGFCLARAALARADRLLLALALAAAASGLVIHKDLVGGRVYDWVIWHGAVTLSAVLLHAACCLALIRRGSPAPAAVADRPTTPALRRAA
jgi:hypothetical protein